MLDSTQTQTSTYQRRCVPKHLIVGNSPPRGAELSEHEPGAGWCYQCKSCGHVVGTDTAFPKKCPGCQAAGWWGKLTPGARQDSMVEGVPQIRGISNHTAELCPAKVGIPVGQPAQDKREVRRGARPRKLPQDLIEQWAREGCGSIVIARKLGEQGIIVSYRTILRRLQQIAA